jgi:hypothetical protein
MTPHDVEVLTRTLRVIRTRPAYGSDRVTVLKVTSQIYQVVELLAMVPDESAIPPRVDMTNLYGTQP